MGVDNHVGSFNIGSFKPGTKIDFGIDNGGGQFFKTGAASGNVDGIEHAKLQKTNEGTLIGFEDLYGGGDRDFNDAILLVRQLSAPNSAAAPKPATSPSPVQSPQSAPSTHPPADSQKINDNRSGLGDGTNPGQGSGTVNSPNQGTQNPNASPTSTSPAVAPHVLNEFQASLALAASTLPKTAMIPKAENQPVDNTNSSAETFSAAKAQSNRSGLGDGTNPGQGAGTSNSPNGGVNNPGQKAVDVQESTASKHIDLFA